MPSHFDRVEFAPPPEPALLRGIALAVLAHLLLVAGLTVGLRWNREEPVAAAEAELWSAVPQQAAPREVAPPAPPPTPPVVQPPPQPEANAQREAQIAVEREKERKAEAQRLAAEERERERRRHEAERRREEELEKREEQRKLAEAKKREDDKRRHQQEQQVAKLREENLRRMQGLADSKGGETSRGAATVSSGPSASWAGRVQARVRPNIVFTDDVSGNPKAEVEVRLAPDGTIVGRRLVHSSGSRAWDDAVLRALDKTEVLPRDVDGRVPSSVVIDFRPKG